MSTLGKRKCDSEYSEWKFTILFDESAKLLFLNFKLL